MPRPDLLGRDVVVDRLLLGEAEAPPGSLKGILDTGQRRPGRIFDVLEQTQAVEHSGLECEPPAPQRLPRLVLAHQEQRNLPSVVEDEGYLVPGLGVSIALEQGPDLKAGDQFFPQGPSATE